MLQPLIANCSCTLTQIRWLPLSLTTALGTVLFRQASTSPPSVGSYFSPFLRDIVRLKRLHSSVRARPTHPSRQPLRGRCALSFVLLNELLQPGLRRGTRRPGRGGTVPHGEKHGENHTVNISALDWRADRRTGCRKEIFRAAGSGRSKVIQYGMRGVLLYSQTGYYSW